MTPCISLIQYYDWVATIWCTDIKHFQAFLNLKIEHFGIAGLFCRNLCEPHDNVFSGTKVCRNMNTYLIGLAESTRNCQEVCLSIAHCNQSQIQLGSLKNGYKGKGNPLKMSWKLAFFLTNTYCIFYKHIPASVPLVKIACNTSYTETGLCLRKTPSTNKLDPKFHGKKFWTKIILSGSKFLVHNWTHFSQFSCQTTVVCRCYTKREYITETHHARHAHQVLPLWLRGLNRQGGAAVTPDL